MITPDDRPATTPEQLLDVVLRTLEDHQAEDTVVIDLAGKSTIGDYMVITSGRSARHVTTLAEVLVRALKEHGIVGVVPEGLAQADWVLCDARDVIVHIFRPEVRAFYNLEKMWGVGAHAAEEARA